MQEGVGNHEGIRTAVGACNPWLSRLGIEDVAGN